MAVKKIFLSYSRRNTLAAVKLKAELTAQGFSVWMDQANIERLELPFEFSNSASDFLLTPVLGYTN